MNKKIVKIGVIGSVVTAICCFTPVLVILFGSLGIAAFVGYLDYVLFPMLGIFLILIMVGFLKQKQDVIQS